MRRLVLICAAAAALVAYGVYEPSPSYVKDKTRLAVIHALIKMTEGMGWVLETFNIGPSEIPLRWMQRLITPKVVNTSTVIFDYRDFAGSNTLVSSPTDVKKRNGAAIIFIHGGGWRMGSPEMCLSLATELTEKLGIVFFGVRYRLAPEHPFPAAFDDSLAAVEAIFDEAESMGIDRSRIAIAGDSAGGQLTASIVQHLRMRKSRHRPKAQVLVYPATQMVHQHTQSVMENRNAPILKTKLLPIIASSYLAGNHSLVSLFLADAHATPKVRAAYLAAVEEKMMVDVDEEVQRSRMSSELESLLLSYKVSPLLNPDIDSLDLPPAFVLACQFDPIRDAALMYVRRLRKAGVKVELKEYHTFHGALGFPNDGRQIRQDIVDYLRSIL